MLDHIVLDCLADDGAYRLIKSAVVLDAADCVKLPLIKALCNQYLMASLRFLADIPQTIPRPWQGDFSRHHPQEVEWEKQSTVYLFVLGLCSYLRHRALLTAQGVQARDETDSIGHRLVKFEEYECLSVREVTDHIDSPRTTLHQIHRLRTLLLHPVPELLF